MNSSNRTADRAGFSLTEIAVVLGIIGIVLGSIWTGYGYVSEQYKQNLLMRDVEYLLVKMTSSPIGDNNFPTTANCNILSSCTPAPGRSCYNPASVNDVTAMLAKLGYLPHDMFNASDPAAVYNPWSSPVTIDTYYGASATLVTCSAANASATGGPSYAYYRWFDIQLGEMSQAACYRMLTENANEWYLRGLIQVCANNCKVNKYLRNNATYAYIKLDTTSINALCGLSDPVSLILWFNWPLADPTQ